MNAVDGVCMPYGIPAVCHFGFKEIIPYAILMICIIMIIAIVIFGKVRKGYAN